MRLISLDQSTRTGWCAANEKSQDKWAFGSFRIPKRDDEGERLVIFRDGLTDLIDRFRPELIGFEAPYLPLQEFRPKKVGAPEDSGPKFNPQTVKLLLMLRGHVMELAARHGIATEEFTSMTWRKTALGFGRAKGVGPADLKRMMIQKAKSLGYAVGDDNEADAIGIMLHLMYGEPASKRQQADLMDLVAL